MAAAAAVHYSILRSLTRSFRSATDIHGGKKSGLHNIQFRPENNYAKIFRDINSFEILYFRLVAVYQHFFTAILFCRFFIPSSCLCTTSATVVNRLYTAKNLFHTHYAINFMKGV